nr:phospholipase-like, aminotransferase-like mobile domain protein [Tanacetum cinerariifolium]
MYTPRAPPVEYRGLCGDYLKKVSLARTLREKDREPFIQSCPKVVSLKDCVKALEGLCDSLMILPNKIKSLKARVYKLETVINNHKDSTSGKQYDLGDKYLSDQDGEPFFKYMGFINSSANKDAVNDLVDALDNLVDENGVVEVDKYLSHDNFLKAQKLEAEKNKVAEQKRLRLQLMLEEANSRKSINFSKSNYMKVSIERCGTNKRRYVDVLRPPIEENTAEKVLSMDRLKNQNNVLGDFMIQMCLNLKPLKETGVFASKGIDPTSYSIKFTNAQNFPKQGGVFGDYGVFVCLFLYRLAHGIPLDVEDPIQIALAYREKMV